MINLDEKQELILHSNKKEIFNKCIFACPGAGKTRLLIAELTYLLQSGVNPEKIVSISFTKKAAHQMKERLKEYNENIPFGIKIGTFHNIALSFLREYEYKNISKYTIIDEHDHKLIVNKILNENFNNSSKDFPFLADKNDYIYLKKVIKNNIFEIIYEKGNNFNLNIVDKINSIINNQKIYLKKIKINILFYKNFLNELYKSIKKYKKSQKVLCFDDIILNFIKFLDTEKGLDLCNNIEYLFVDEYQDVNNSQGILLEKIYNNNNNIVFTVVGDDAQSIYKFRGSEPKYIREFEDKFVPCKRFILENNYRSSPEIINLCNFVINNNNDNIKKEMKFIKNSNTKPSIALFDNEKIEAAFVSDTINNLINSGGYKYHEIAVLSRTNKYTSALELLFIKNKIPYHNLSGLSLFEMKHIKDFMSFIYLIINPLSEIHFTRILMMIKNVGQKTIDSIIKKINKNNDNFLNFIINMQKNEDYKKYYKKLQNINYIFKEIIDTNLNLKKNCLETYLVIYEFIKNYIQDNYDKINERIDDIEKLEYFFNVYDNLNDMIIDLHLNEDSDTYNVSNQKVLISTIHQSKGLEFKNIFLIGAHKCPLMTSIHNDEDIFEERRTFFVALSRAIDNLSISLIKEENNFLNKFNKDEKFNTSYGSIYINEIIRYCPHLVENLNYNLPNIINSGNLSDIIKNKILINGPSYIHKQMNNLEYIDNNLKNTYQIDATYYPKLVGMMFDLIITRIFIEKYQNYKNNQNIFYELKEVNICQPLIEIFTDYKIPINNDNVLDSILKLSVFCNYNAKYLLENQEFLNNVITKFKERFNNFYFKEYLVNLKKELFELIENYDDSTNIYLHKYIHYNKVKGQIDLLINDTLIEIKYSKFNLFNAMNITQILSYNSMAYYNDIKIKTNMLLNPCTGQYIIIENNDNNLSISKNIFNNFIKN